MALDPAIVWEIRTTGAQTNGGGFKTGATGMNYSQQDAAQWDNLAVTSAGAGTTMLTASAAATMVGNVLRVVSGTNATIGWYEITGVSVGTSITTDRNWCTGACADGVVNIGGAFKIGGSLDSDFFLNVNKAAGNTVWIQAGTYTLGENVYHQRSGTTLLPINVFGYNSSRGDNPIGDNRPLIDGGANYSWDVSGGGANYYIHKGIRFTTGVTGPAFSSGGYAVVVNCKGTNTRISPASTNSRGIGTGDNCVVLHCEASSVRGVAFYAGSYGFTGDCYFHDSDYGLYGGAYGSLVCSVIDTCQYGIYSTGSYVSRHLNTIRNCLVGIYSTTGANHQYVNNIIANCATGASWATAEPINYWDYNCWSNNDTDTSNVTKGDHDVTDDALLGSSVAEGTDGATNAAGTAFTAASNPFSGVTTSDCVNIIETGTGATLGVYGISAVVGDGELTLSRTAGANKANIDYRIVKGTDFTLQTGSPCFNAGLKLGSDVGL